LIRIVKIYKNITNETLIDTDVEEEYDMITGAKIKKSEGEQKQKTKEEKMNEHQSRLHESMKIHQRKKSEDKVVEE